MKVDNKRVIICFPNQPNLSGLMTLDFAKSKVDENSPNKSEIVSVIVMNDKNEVVSCIERNNGEWKEKEVIQLD